MDAGRIRSSRSMFVSAAAVTLQRRCMEVFDLRACLGTLMNMHRLLYARPVEQADVRANNRSAAVDTRRHMFAMYVAMHRG